MLFTVFKMRYHFLLQSREHLKIKYLDMAAQ